TAAVVRAIAPQVWLMDAARGVDAAHALANGTFGTDRGYLYSPLAALLILATTWIPAGATGMAWLAARVGVLVAAIRRDTRGLAPPDRLLAGGAATLVALAIVGTGPYLAWIEVLRHPEYLAGPQGGNFALTGFFPLPVALALGAASIVAGFLALRRGETPGLLAALAIGLLCAPYTLAYGAVFLLLAARPLASVLQPSVILVLALAAPVLVLVFLPGLA